MTPPATIAARRSAAPAGKGSGHRRAIARPAAAPRVPRRVSGPAHSGRPAAVGRPLAARALAGFAALPDHRLVDRLLRGRSWIAVIGTLLIGLVAMQVSMLKLNAGIGRAVERSSNLDRANGELRATVSRLSSGQRIQQEATRLGLVMPSAGEIHYVSAERTRDARGATAALASGTFENSSAVQADMAPGAPAPAPIPAPAPAPAAVPAPVPVAASPPPTAPVAAPTGAATTSVPTDQAAPVLVAPAAATGATGAQP